MTEKELFDAMRSINPQYILEAAPAEKKVIPLSTRRWLLPLVAALCCVALVSTGLLWPVLNPHRPPVEKPPASTSDSPTTSATQPSNLWEESPDEPEGEDAPTDDGTDKSTAHKATTTGGNHPPVVSDPTTRKTVNTTRKTTTSAKKGNVITEPTTKKTTLKATTTRKTKPNRCCNDRLYRNVTIATGTSKLETTAGSTLRDNTYTALVWTSAREELAGELTAFQAKYGCDIQLNSVAFEDVNKTLATALASQQSYDLVRVHGSWYPYILMNGYLKPLENSFTMQDVTTANDKSGIDLEKSRYFAWGSRLYTTTTYYDTPLYFLYYNKTLLKGAKDPVKLFEQGQWTWSKMKELAADYTGSVCWSDDAMDTAVLLQSNEGSLLKMTPRADGSDKLEVSLSGNRALQHSLQYLQGLTGLGTGTGLYAPQKVLAAGGSSHSYQNLVNGRIAVWPAESTHYKALYNAMADPAHLGVAPVPYGVDNTGRKTAAGWLTGFGTTKYSQSTAPRLVALFTKFHSTYRATATAADRAYNTVVEQFADWGLYEQVNYCDFAYGPTDTENMMAVLNKITAAVKDGQDITATLKKYDNQAEGYLKDALSAQ